MRCHLFALELGKMAMVRRFCLAILLAIIGVVNGALPIINDCHPAQATPLDNSNPGALFGFNQEIAGKASPARVGTLRQQGPLPTGHFATGHIKSQTEVWPMIQTPYQVMLTDQGAVTDAYTMDRWSRSDRTDLMEQQSAWETGKPWHKLNEMGSNLKQMTSGPDGNPLGVFTGKSGIRISFAGIGEPEMTSFGELYANFIYRSNGGSMEVPVVRGSALMTHIMKSANPVIKPNCLSRINDQLIKFNCQKEASAADGGVGFLEGACHGSTLTVLLHSSKVIPDVSKIQWSAEVKSNWGHKYMRNCDVATCKLEDGGKTVRITVPKASGVMNYAINYIGHYLLPSDWTNKPGETTCRAKRDVNQTDELKRAESSRTAHMRTKRSGVSMSATCSTSGELTINLDLGSYSLPGYQDFQYAVEPVSQWMPGFVPPMRDCDSSHCSHVGSLVTIKATIPVSDYKLALNIIRITTLPQTNWIQQPFQGRCDGSTITYGDSPPQPQHPQTTTPIPTPTTPTPTPPPTTTTQKSTPSPAPTDTPFHTTQSENQPPQTPKPNDGGQPSDFDTKTPGTKFIFELDEPGNSLPQQTRKFVAYFSSPVTPKVDLVSEEITFEPQSGGQFTGVVQIAYTGSGTRGDNSNASYFDSYAGYYSYKPEVEYCASLTMNKTYLSYDWNAVDHHGNVADGEHLLMVAMPHHVLLLEKYHTGRLQDTPLTFKGYRGGEWLMEMDVLHTEIAPEALGVQKVKDNSIHLQEMLAAIDRDSKNTNLDAICSHSDSYNVGKSIGMVARLASISRAFGTNHYTHLDTSIKNCLEKWLRVQDSLANMWKFRYDMVWGGLFLRATDGNLNYGADYGFPFYNDHHFHIGYFLYSLAYYVKHYPQWGQAHKTRIYSLARDVGNPSAHDSFFPVARQKDMYTGFSWASGIVPGTRQEESASEGINCYHGLAALGDAFHDDNMRQTGQVLLAMEVLSVREYWQVRAHNRAHFPPLLQRFGVVGMVTEPAFYAYTLNWPCDPNIFPQRHGCLVGIQVIPITSVSHYWMDKEWAASIEETCQSAIDPTQSQFYALADKTADFSRHLQTGWQAFCYTAMAPLDDTHAQQAADFIKGRKPQELVGGTGAASTLLFILAST